MYRLRLLLTTGTGTPAENTLQVNLLIDEYKRMEKMVGKMGKSGLFGKGKAGLSFAITRADCSFGGAL